MKDEPVRPAALRPGDTIGIIAPASPLADRSHFDRGISALREMGFHAQYDDRIFESTRYLAGDDASRAQELMRQFEDPTVKAVVPLRGGYGCARLLGYLDKDRLRQHCKVFMGFSDLTTLHLYLYKSFRWITFHGPMISSPFWAQSSEPLRQHLLSLWCDPGYRPRFSLPGTQSWHGGCADGILVGGCLSLITTSLGTPFEISCRNKILFLEDSGEAPYRVDRMLTHLRLAGKFHGIKGIILGNFAQEESASDPEGMEQTLRSNLVNLDVPLVSRFPAGHATENWPLPLGLRVRLDADDASLTVLESAVC